MKKLYLIIGGCVACAAGFVIGIAHSCRKRIEDKRFVEQRLQVLEGEGGIVLD